MLSKQYRLTKRGSFTYVYNKGARSSRGVVSLTFVKSKAGTKIGFSVPNKVGKANVRNKLKRQMRAIVRDCIKLVLPSQIVFSLRLGASDLSFKELKQKINELLTRAKLVV